MKRSALALLVSNLFLTGGVALSQTDQEKPFLGTWEYRQAAGENAYDQEGEKLILLPGPGHLRGLYFGLEREGEHGLFYTAVEVKDLVVGKGGRISFRVPERALFRARPRSIEEAEQRRIPSAGLTRDELQMEGPLQGNRLTLKCKSSQAIACPEEIMVFRKDRAPRRPASPAQSR